MNVIFIRFFLGLGLLGSSCGASAAEQGSPPKRIGIEVLADGSPATKEFPIATGLIFPEGELREASGAVVDAQGKPVSFESEVTGWWNAEKSHVKWLLLRFKASAGQTYAFVPGGTPLRPSGAPIASVRDGVVNIDTGPLRASISGAKPALFATAMLQGKSMLSPEQPEPALSLADAERATHTALRDWKVVVEDATPLYASIKATGFFHSVDGLALPRKPVAKLEVRYEFFKGESFARVFHTLTWMVSNYQVSGREISIGLRPAAEIARKIRIGSGEDPAAATEAEWSKDKPVYALQDDARHFSIKRGADKLAEGKRLSGWMSAHGADGRGITFTLRHPWQTFPKAFAAGADGLQLQLWPAQAPSMSFAPLAIMTPEHFYHPTWKNYAWSRELGHFVHERARHEFFQYTAEGAARTHEFTVYFHDASSPRSPAELSALTQRTIVLRQDPASAMRVPFMGFMLMPAQKRKHPDIERALDMLGRMSMGRWTGTHDYGMWRFGFTRWGVPPNSDNGASMYRWMDGGQYDQTLIPWLLYLRGGDRQFLEEAEISSRFLMDVGVNHFNTRGYPTGYMSTAGGTPFPYIPFHNTKGTKVHFLSYYYHLTGYKRAKEVMEEVIAGTLATTSKDPAELPPWYRRTGGREAYNMNVFWVNAYHETWDPRVRGYAEEWKNLAARREYVPALNEFRPPRIYLYNGLVLQHRLWRDAQLGAAMLRNLEGTVLTEPASGRDRHVENAIGSQWAFEQTGNRRYIEIAGDLAHTLADVVPDMDFGGEKPPPFSVRGNEFYRQFVMPILVGASVADAAGLSPQQLVRRDTFFSLTGAAKADPKNSGTVLIRPKQNGDLPILVRLSRAARQKVRVTLRDPADRVIADAELQATEGAATRAAGEGYELLDRKAAVANLVLPAARRDETYRLECEGLDATTCVLVLADAQIAYQVSEDGALAVHDLGGQYFGGARFFARTTEDVVTVVSKNAIRSPYTIRDAETWEVLFRSKAGDPVSQRHNIGKGRLISFVVAGDGPHSQKRIAGIERFVSATRDDWFAPSQSR